MLFLFFVLFCLCALFINIIVFIIAMYKVIYFIVYLLKLNAFSNGSNGSIGIGSTISISNQNNSNRIGTKKEFEFWLSEFRNKCDLVRCFEKCVDESVCVCVWI